MPSSGWGSLGEVLAGELTGANPGMRQASVIEAQAQGRYRSAQTEQALAAATKAQAEARLHDQEEAFRREVGAANAAALRSGGLAGALVAGGMGSDYSGFESGAQTALGTELMGKMADPNTTDRDRFYAGAALDKKPASPFDVTAGGSSFVDMRNPGTAPVTTSLGNSLIDENAAQAQLHTAQATNPSAFRSAPAATAGMTPEQRIAYERDLAGERTEGRGLANRALDLPSAKAKLSSVEFNMGQIKTWSNRLLADTGLWQAVGPAQLIGQIPGTDGARVRGMLATLKANTGAQALQAMRDASKTGGAVGNVTDYEQKLFQSMMAALDENMSVGDFLQQLQYLNEFVDASITRQKAAFMEMYPESATPPSPQLPGQTPPVAASVPAGTQPPTPAAPAAGGEWTVMPNGVRVRVKQ